MAGISSKAAGSLENFYKYNEKTLEHKEFSEGSGLEWYDYGARMFDPQIGRWHVRDALSAIFSNESGYSYAGNNPIINIDQGGLFRISAYFVRKYPMLAKSIRDYLPLLKDNPQAKAGWIKAVGFKNIADGEKAFDEMVTYGKGPWITPTRDNGQKPFQQNLNGFFEPTGKEGEWQGTLGFPNNITIKNFRLNELQAKAGQGNLNELGMQLFAVNALIMHESAHWGKWKYSQIPESIGDDNWEAGANFEENTFGTRFSYVNSDKRYFDFQRAGGYYNQQKGNYGTSSFGFSVNQDELYYWRLIQHSSTPSGQLGDPSLKENGDKEWTLWGVY